MQERSVQKILGSEKQEMCPLLSVTLKTMHAAVSLILSQLMSINLFSNHDIKQGPLLTKL